MSIVGDHARDRGGAPAVTGDGRTVSYAELDERSSRCAQALLDAGLGAGSRVAYVGKNAPEYFDLLFGAAKIGAVTAPVNWGLTPPEIAAVVADAQAPVTLVDAEFASLAGELPGRIVVTGAEHERWPAGHPAEDPGFTGRPDDIVVPLHLRDDRRHRPARPRGPRSRGSALPPDALGRAPLRMGRDKDRRAGR
ncbi:AMP-binding enzyme [Actinomadura madurae]|uniref:AMP-binding enzyme n=1 Tax=Actinomadura madurae TaxID=1993 RepID=A0A1I5Y6P8_9ACTN|nr:AMP-binding enzyme [Actinomadura madurae]SPT59531.1 Surfactin synthase subunit 3 [Actinomadura madurae]